MGKIVMMTLRVPQDAHRKLKVMSVMSGKSMAQEFTQMVSKVNLKVPDFDCEMEDDAQGK